MDFDLTKSPNNKSDLTSEIPMSKLNNKMKHRSFADDAFSIFIGCVLAISSNFNYGYSTAFLNTPVDEFKDYLNTSLTKMGHTMTESTYDTIWNLILNISFVGFFFGIFLNPLINDRYGRKVGFLLGNFVTFFSSVLRCVAIFTYRPELLFVSRILTSVCNAVIYPVLILYLQECAPTHLRGSLCFISEIMFASFCMFAMLLGTNQLLGQHLFWFTFAPLIPSFFAFVVLFWIPETPKFLLITKKNKEAAEKSIRFFHGKTVDVGAIFKEFEQESSEDPDGASLLEVCKDIFKKDYLRNAVMLSCLCMQNCVGMWSYLLSSTYFLEQTDVSTEIAEWSSTGMMICYILGTVVGAFFIERYGRRPLLMIFTSLNVLTQIIYVVFDKLHYHVDPLKYGCVAMLAFYGFTYGVAVGPISWFISSELVPQRYRSSVQAVCYSVNTIMVVGTTFSILPLYHLIGSYAFIALYVGPSCLCLIYMFKYLPETKNQEIHEIVSYLKRKGSD